jgi:hypothetical protein
MDIGRKLFGRSWMKNSRYEFAAIAVLCWLLIELRLLALMEEHFRSYYILHGRGVDWWLCLAALSFVDAFIAFIACLGILRGRLKSREEYFSLAADWIVFGILRSSGLELTDTIVTPMLDRVALGWTGWILLGASFAWALIAISKWGRYGKSVCV